MNNLSTKYFYLGFSIILFSISILLGAVGAHLLEAKLDPKFLAIFNKAVYYQQINCLGLMILAYFLKGRDRLISIPTGFILLGMILFSGSLYFYVWTRNLFFVKITPVGGMMMILAWLFIGIIFLTRIKRKS
jgi:uncharacterized membrane protein YgdD (TMEM256/DUF423 family)